MIDQNGKEWRMTYITEIRNIVEKWYVNNGCWPTQNELQSGLGEMIQDALNIDMVRINKQGEIEIARLTA